MRATRARFQNTKTNISRGAGFYACARRARGFKTQNQKYEGGLCFIDARDARAVKHERLPKSNFKVLVATRSSGGSGVRRVGGGYAKKMTGRSNLGPKVALEF